MIRLGSEERLVNQLASNRSGQESAMVKSPSQSQIKNTQNRDKLVISKFTKEVISVWQTLPVDEQDQQYEMINYLIFKEFLSKLGFINETLLVQNNAHSQSSNLISDLWNCLSLQGRETITLNNFRVFLLAIMGIHLDNGSQKHQKLIKSQG